LATDRVLLRNSERTAFTTCRFRWDLTYGGQLEIGPLRSREPAKALWFGDLVHQGLAKFYKPGVKRGPKPATTFIKLYDADERLSALYKNDEGEWETLRDLGRGMLTEYAGEFASRDGEWEVISSERTFRLPIVVPRFTHPEFGIEIPEFKLIVVGTFDGIWRNRADKDRVVFKEFKTAAQIALDGLALDEQASMYWTYGPKWCWRQKILPAKTYPTEILYTFLRKSYRDREKHNWDEAGRRLNKDGSVSKVQPSPFFVREPIYRDLPDRVHAHDRLVEQAREMMLARAGVLDSYKVPGPLHNPNCRGCPVRDACVLHESGHDWMSILRATTEPWDPYSAHDIIERR
jgi:hypothetical protein